MVSFILMSEEDTGTSDAKKGSRPIEHIMLGSSVMISW